MIHEATMLRAGSGPNVRCNPCTGVALPTLGLSVGLGAAAYSPAKYGILTELLPNSQLVKANGLTLFPDWSSDTMLTTMGTNFQKMMAGRQSVADTSKAIQADWIKFDKTLK